MDKIVLALCVMISLSGCFIKMTPQQHALLPINDNPGTISSDEIKGLFKIPVQIEDGDYKTVPLGLVKQEHEAPWCFPGTYGGKNGINDLRTSDLLSPMDWDSYRYSRDALKGMEGYAFGLAHVKSNIDGEPDFIVNVLITESHDRRLYNAVTCQWLDPHDVSNIVIKGGM